MKDVREILRSTKTEQTEGEKKNLESRSNMEANEETPSSGVLNRLKTIKIFTSQTRRDDGSCHRVKEQLKSRDVSEIRQRREESRITLQLKISEDL